MVDLSEVHMQKTEEGKRGSPSALEGPFSFPYCISAPEKGWRRGLPQTRESVRGNTKGSPSSSGFGRLPLPFFAARRGMVFNTLAVERRLSPRQSSLRRRRCWRRDEDIFPGLAFPHSLYGKTFVFAPSVRHTPAHSTL